MCRTAFRELYCRATNPARHLMLWLPEVRRAPVLFRAFRARMMQLLQEARRYFCSVMRSHIKLAVSTDALVLCAAV